MAYVQKNAQTERHNLAVLTIMELKLAPTELGGVVLIQMFVQTEQLKQEQPSAD